MVHSYIHCLCVNVIKKLCASASVSAIQRTLEWRILFYYPDKEQHITTIHFFFIRSKQKKKQQQEYENFSFPKIHEQTPNNNLRSTSSFWLFLNSKFNYFTTFCAHFFCGYSCTVNILWQWRTVHYTICTFFINHFDFQFMVF